MLPRLLPRYLGLRYGVEGSGRPHGFFVLARSYCVATATLNRAERRGTQRPIHPHDRRRRSPKDHFTLMTSKLTSKIPGVHGSKGYSPPLRGADPRYDASTLKVTLCRAFTSNNPTGGDFPRESEGQRRGLGLSLFALSVGSQMFPPVAVRSEGG